MRYILLCISLFFLTYNLTAQQHDVQNANWYFGSYAAITFLPDPQNPTSVNTNPDHSVEGCASVSDSAGNLLFYSNGLVVRDRNHNVMPNGTGIIGGQSNTQGPIIVPRPQSTHYYLVTIGGGTSNQGEGLYYSEIDMNANSTLGDIMTSVKNVVLYDHNNIPIDTNYGNKSEKLTSTKHCNGDDYWIITQIGDYVYSYLVTNSGISSTPVSYTQAPIDANFNNGVEFNGIGQVKISPDSKRIAICYNHTYNGGMSFGDFNNTTGEVSIVNTIYGSNDDEVLRAYSTEFSPSSKYCYFTSDTGLYIMPADSPYIQNVITINNEANPYGTPLQLAINGKIYFHRTDITIPLVNIVGAINDPNNVSNPNIDESAVSTLPGIASLSFPQWVHWQGDNCAYSTTLTNPEISYMPYTYAYSHSITTSGNYTVSDAQNIKMEAGSLIELSPNTYIEGGSEYLAQIKECGKCTSSSQRPAKMDIGTIESSKSDINANRTDLTLFPNPAKDFAEITYLNGISNIIVTSIDGKVVYQGQVNDNKYILDTKAYNKGIYLISVQTNEGNIITKKLIIN